MATTFEDVLHQISAFNEERDWSRFHTPRNLVLALVGEVGELAELVQWVPDDHIPKWVSDKDNLARLEHEVADVLIYALQLAGALGLDPGHIIKSKIALNATKYPTEEFRSSSRKYNAGKAAEDVESPQIDPTKEQS